MARRPTTKASRAARASAYPTPVQSSYNTPLGSALPSTCASEAEWDVEDDVSKIPISALTLQDPSMTPTPVVEKPKQKSKPFRLMDLPSELRLKVYDFYFGIDRVIDLDPDNYKQIFKKMVILRTCRTVYHEATYVLYSTHTFRLFPTHPGRFFKTKKPLLARLTPRQRGKLTSLELRLGPGWSKPPRGWVVNTALGLADCKNVRKLNVFVECDPSDGIFNGFRRADGFYEKFSRNLLDEVLQAMPWVDRVQFDAWSSVKKSGGMMRKLVPAAEMHGRRVAWGPERGWSDRDGDEIVDTTHAATATALLNGVGMNVVVVA